MADFDRSLPAHYTCHRCSKKGHLIKNCPTNGDPAFDFKDKIRGFNKAGTNQRGTNQGRPRNKRPLIPSFSTVNNDPTQNQQYFKKLATQRHGDSVDSKRRRESHETQRHRESPETQRHRESPETQRHRESPETHGLYPNNPTLPNGHHSYESSNYDRDDTGKLYHEQIPVRPEPSENQEPQFSIRIPSNAATNHRQEMASTRRVNIKPVATSADVKFSINFPDQVVARYYQPGSSSSSAEEEVVQSRSVVTGPGVVKHSLVQPSHQPSPEEEEGPGVYSRLGPVNNAGNQPPKSERRVRCKRDSPAPQYHSRFSPEYEACDDIDGEKYDEDEDEITSPPKDRRLKYKETSSEVASTNYISGEKVGKADDKPDRKRPLKKMSGATSSDHDGDEHDKKRDKSKTRKSKSKKHKHKEAKKLKKSKKAKKKKSKSHKRSRQSSTSSDVSHSSVEISEPDISEFTNEPVTEPDISEFTNEPQPPATTQDPVDAGQKIILDILREAIKKQGAATLEKKFLTPKPEAQKQSNMEELDHSLAHPRSTDDRSPTNLSDHGKDNASKQAKKNSKTSPFKNPSTKPIYKDVSPVHIAPSSAGNALTKMDYIAAKYLSAGSMNQPPPPNKPRRGPVIPFDNPSYKQPPGPSLSVPTVKDWNTGNPQLAEISHMQKVPTKRPPIAPGAGGLTSCDTCKDYNLTPSQLKDHQSQDQHLMATGEWWDHYPNPSPIPQYCLIYCVLCRAGKMVGVDFATIEEHETSKDHKKSSPKWKEDYGKPPRSTWCPLTLLRTTASSGSTLLPMPKSLQGLPSSAKPAVRDMYKEAINVLQSRGLVSHHTYSRMRKFYKHMFG